MDNIQEILEQERQEAIQFIHSCGYQKFDTRLIVPPSQKTIPKWVCSNNNYLQTIIISEGVQEIEDGAFEYCRCLSNVVLPKSIRHLGRGIFNGCDALQSVSFHLESLKTVYADSFGNHVDYYTKCVKKLYIGIVNSKEKVDEFPQLYGFPRQGIEEVPVGIDSEGNEVSIRYRVEFPAGEPIYKPGGNLYYSLPEKFTKSEPKVSIACVDNASLSTPINLGTLDGEVYPVTSWKDCLYYPAIFPTVAKKQNPILNDSEHPWSFIQDDKPVKTFDVTTYLMKVYYGEVDISEPILIVWDSVDDK